MANQPESATYDAGVYQLEVVDPVQGGLGGVANSPLLNLANRTAWLKAQITAILAALAGYAPLNSPALTGTPTTPDPLDGDISGAIATTRFVNNIGRGIASVNVAGSGNITLLQAAYGRGIIVLTGTLTGARSVIVPNNGRWIISNATSGSFALTVKTAAGTGQVVITGRQRELYADGTNVQRAENEVSPSTLVALTGSQSIPNNLETAVSWPTPVSDPYLMFASGTPDRVTIPAGVSQVRIHAQATFTANATGARKFRILVNGTREGSGLPASRLGTPDAADVSIMNGAGGVVTVSPGDYIQLMVYQTSGAGLSLVGNNTWATVEVIG